jgi:hypothetical protein
MRVTGRTLALLLLLVGSVSLMGQAPTGKVRVIPYAPGMPIPERVLPTDEIVRLDRRRDPEPAQPATAAAFLRQLLDGSQIVAVVRVFEVRGILAEDGAWIHTEAIVRIEAPLLDKDRALVAGANMNLQWSGGELLLGNAVVKGWEPPRIKEDKQYVIFHSGSGMLGTLAAYELLPDRKLASTWPVDRTRIKDPLDGASYDDVNAEVRLRR